jgi:hypothetical protein
MFKGWTENDGFALFAGVVALFSLWQILLALRTGRILSIYWWAGMKGRKENPIHFWGSLTYYFVWVGGTACGLIDYFANGGGIPFSF